MLIQGALDFTTNLGYAWIDNIKFIMKKIILAAIVIWYCSMGSAVAQAAQYVFESGNNNNIYNAQTIVDPQNQQYIYGMLSKGQDTTDYYSLEFQEYTPQVQIRLLVPDKEETKNFYPSLIMTDPYARGIEGQTPFGFPVNTGARVFDWSQMEETLTRDETMLETFRVGPSIVKDISPNKYILTVFDPGANGGKYVLEIGAKAAPNGWKTILNKITAFIRIKLYLY